VILVASTFMIDSPTFNWSTAQISISSSGKQRKKISFI